jgi:hypothetical protein
LMLLQTHHAGSHMIGLLIQMMAHNAWLFKLWDILTWSILLIPHWFPLYSYSEWLWNNYHIYESPMHCCMWFVDHWVGTHVFESWIDGCSWGHFPTILPRTKLWVHFCNSFKFDQKTLFITTPSLGLATKLKACKGAGQEGNSRVTSHVPESVGECEEMNPHTPKWAPTLGVRVSMDSQIFRE